MADIVQPDIALKDLEDRWGVARNTLKNWASKLGVDIKNPTPRSAFWPGEYIDLGDQLAAWLRAGNELAAFPYILQMRHPEMSMTPQPQAASEQTGGGAITQVGGSQLANKATDSELTETIQRIDTTEVDDDPHAEWDDVERALTGTRWYTNARMARILRLSESTVQGYKSGEMVFPGVFLEKQDARGKVWCRLYQEGVTDMSDMSASHLTAVPAKKEWNPMGGALEAQAQMINVTPVVQLPGFLR